MPKKPVFGTTEWAAHNANIFLGCQHDCKYCFGKAMAVRFGRATPESWKTPLLNKKALSAKRAKKTGTIMFPSTHDLCPDNSTENLDFLQKILAAGNDVLVVTKPHLEVIDKMTTDLWTYKNKILFRFTIGSPDTKVLKFWEPGAPSFDERFEALKLAYARGFQTSISSEPMLDVMPEMIHLFRIAKPYITNSHWMGKMNDSARRLAFNGHADAIPEAKKLIDYWTDSQVKKFYDKLKDEPTIRWKESIKKIVGLEIPTTKGMDV